MISKFRIGALVIILNFFASVAMIWGQDNPSLLQMAVPSLNIAPDARGGGMGDMGAATLPDINSQYWNAAKYAFMGSKAGVSLSYTPWLRKLVNDVALVNMTGYYKLGNSDLQAISASLRYFSLGEVNIWENIGDVPYGLNPYEMAFDVAYSRKLSESYSMAVTLRYIRSDMGTDQNDESNAGNAFSADISGYLEKYVLMGNAEALWSFGFNLSNIGSKISYDGGNTNQYLPAKLTLGTGLLYPIDDYNQIGVYLDLNKYMVRMLRKRKKERLMPITRRVWTTINHGRAFPVC